MTELVKSTREEFVNETELLFVKEFTDGKGHLTRYGFKIMVLFGIALSIACVQFMFNWVRDKWIS